MINNTENGQQKNQTTSRREVLQLVAFLFGSITDGLTDKWSIV